MTNKDYSVDRIFINFVSVICSFFRKILSAPMVSRIARARETLIVGRVFLARKSALATQSFDPFLFSNRELIATARASLAPDKYS